jgi:hypothetical protein
MGEEEERRARNVRRGIWAGRVEVIKGGRGRRRGRRCEGGGEGEAMRGGEGGVRRRGR